MLSVIEYGPKVQGQLTKSQLNKITPFINYAGNIHGEVVYLIYFMDLMDICFMDISSVYYNYFKMIRNIRHDI